MIFLVRHAKAGRRGRPELDDLVRPLSKAGWSQAKALVEPLLAAGAGPPLLSSPYTRCVQTLEPLAARLDVNVIVDERLAEEQPFEPLLELLIQTPEGTVLCSHGDLIPDVMAALERRRCKVTAEPNWKKGSVWALTRSRHGTFISAECWPPPR